MEKLVAALVAQGISPEIAESMAKSFKPKKERSPSKGNNFFSKPKISIEVEVEVICNCCGATETQIKTVETKDGNSPTTMKLPVSCCKNCPDYFRALTHEQLVSLALAAHNPSIQYNYPRTSSRVKLAKKLTPEEMVTFKSKSL